MNISPETISALEKIIAGNKVAGGRVLSPYRTGPKLVTFFNQFGADDTYSHQEFPARWHYTETKIRESLGIATLAKIIEQSLDPRYFLSANMPVDEAADYLNSFLKLDGYRLDKVGEYYRVREVGTGLISISAPFLATGKPNHQFILEQIAKCEQKVAEGDFDGAITNARAMLEAVLLEMEQRLDPAPPSHDGDLLKLYRRVQQQLNLDPSRKDLTDSLKQILTGLISIVNGISSVRNRMSDAHARRYKPYMHHAELAVNSARTVAAFLFSTYEYQLENGHILVESGEAAETEVAQ